VATATIPKSDLAAVVPRFPPNRSGIAAINCELFADWLLVRNRALRCIPPLAHAPLRQFYDRKEGRVRKGLVHWGAGDCDSYEWNGRQKNAANASDSLLPVEREV